jgi:Secretion system C-terminal sorting domain
LCGLNGNNSSVATFPWTSSSTIPYYYSASATSGALSAVHNPFFDPGCGSNTNILKFCGVPNPDFGPSDGWEFLHAHLGTSSVGVKHPSFTLYNRHTGILRVFTNLTTATPGQVALIKVGNLGTKKTSLLSAYEAGESHALDQFGSVQLQTPAVPNRNVQSGYRWVYADFKTVYDPCTCTLNSDLQFDVIIVNQSSLDAQINLVFNLNQEATLIGESKVAMGTGKDLVSTVLGTGADGAKYVKDLLGKGDEGSTIEALTKVLPQIGAALSIVKMIYSIANPAAPTTTVTKFDGKIRGTIKGAANGFLTGTLTNEQYVETWTIRTPGSSSTPFLPSQATHYNEVLGVFHLLKAPVVTRTKLQFEYMDDTNPEMQIFTLEKREREQFSCTAPLEYILNPAAYVCLDDLEASYFIEYTDGKTEESESMRWSCFQQFVYKSKRGINEYYWCATPLEYNNAYIKNVYVKLSGQLTPFSGNGTKVTFAELYHINGSTQPPIYLETPNFSYGIPSSCNNYYGPPDASAMSNLCYGTTYKQASGQFLAKKQEEEAKAAAKAKGDLNVNISPNPVQNALLISYNLPKEESKVAVQVLNINGQVVATILPQTVQKIGEQTLTYNATELTNGVYMIRILADENSKVIKMVVAH